MHKVNIPIYHGKLFIFFTKDFNKVAKKYNLKKLIGEDLNGFGAFCTAQENKKGITQYFLIFGKKPSHSIIAHECIHAVNWIMSDRKIAPDLINDEPQAYLLGWVVSQVYKARLLHTKK